MTIKKAIIILKRYKHTHIAWSTYLKKYPEFPTEHVGSIKHHEKCIEEYDGIIECFERRF